MIDSRCSSAACNVKSLLVRLESSISREIAAHPANFAKLLAFIPVEDLKASLIRAEEGVRVVHVFIIRHSGIRMESCTL